MKLARELSKRQTGRTLYLLDEPTTGLHFDDVRRLLDVLHRLTDLGNTVIIIEHNLDIIRNADYLLDMGPEGGEGGGTMVGHGTPEQLATVAGSYTGQFLRPHFPGLTVLDPNPNAGAQPATIAAAADAVKQPKAKFIPNEKKTGRPTARPAAASPAASAPAKIGRKTAAKKVAAKKTAKRMAKA
jgi:excinuclease ABC subunit A